MPAPLADVFSMTVAAACQTVAMTGEETGDDMTDPGVGCVFSKDWRPTGAVSMR